MHLFLDPLINLFYLKYRPPPPRSRSTIETFKLQEKTKIGHVLVRWFGLVCLITFKFALECTTLPGHVRAFFVCVGRTWGSCLFNAGHVRAC